MKNNILIQLEKTKTRFEKLHPNNIYPMVTDWVRDMISPICKIHGLFTIRRGNHLKGFGCPTCGLAIQNKIYENKFKYKANIKHNNKWDYSKVVYQGCNVPVCIGCEIHGEFYQTTSAHLRGVGCPRCYNNNTYTTERWIELAKVKHNERYDYSLVKYTGSKNKVPIICKEHGVFNQIASDHLLGNNCPRCTAIALGIQQRYTRNEVISRFKQIHGTKYLYHLVDYTTAKRKIIIICRKHGPFNQMSHSHMSGRGCPRCVESKGEGIIAKILDKNNIKYIREFSFPDSTWRYDFFLPDLNILIECDGMQHYKPIKFYGGVKGLNKIQKRDRQKNKLADKNNMILIRVQYNTITALVNDFIKEMFKVYPHQLDNILFSVYKNNKKGTNNDI